MDLTALTVTNYQIIIPLFSSVIFFLLFVVVLSANAKSTVNRAYAWYLIFNCIWGFASFLNFLNIAPSEELIVNVVQRGVGIVPSFIAFLYFSLVFLKKNARWWMIFLIPTAIIYLFIFAYGLIITVADTDLGAYGPHGRLIPGPIFFEGLGYMIVISLIPIALLCLEFLRGSREKVYRSKLRFLLFASFIITLFSILYNLNPKFWEFPYDTIGSLVGVVVIIYAMLKYELVDINTYFRNLLVHTLLTSFVMAIYIMIIAQLQNLFLDVVGEYFWWLAFVMALMLGMLFRPINDWIIKKLDKLFYRQRYDYRQTLVKFATEVGDILDLGVLSNSIVEIIKEAMGAKFVYIYHTDGKGNITAMGSAPAEISFNKEDTIIKSLSQEERVLTLDEATRFFKDTIGGIPDRIQHLKCDLVVPLKAGGDLEGIAFIGPRQSGDFYSQEDTNLLFTLSRPAASAMKNARLYAEVVGSRDELKELYAHDKEVQELKDQFVTIASHELRTPLTAIKGYAEIIGGEQLSGEGKKSMINMYVNIKRLENLTEELINIASIEKGGLKPIYIPTDIGKLLQEICDGTKPIASSKGLDFKCSITPSDIGKVMIDPRLIRHAVANLLDNAVKFTSKGSVQLMAVKKMNDLLIMVKDTGPGIARNKQNFMFQKFSKASSYTGAVGEGHGLGLYLTKLAIDAHNGKIDFESGSHGSTFSVHLPLKQTPTPKEEVREESKPAQVSEIKETHGAKPRKNISNNRSKRK